MYSGEDGFIRVSRRSSNKQVSIDQRSTTKYRQLHKASIGERMDDESDDDQFEQLTDQQLEKIVKFYETKATKFMQTDYFQHFRTLFVELVHRPDDDDQIEFDQVICYGLGSFNRETICRKQLYFLICLRRLLKCSSWEIYDPVFGLDEEAILERLGFVLITTNEQCRRSIKEADVIKKTLFYMPHCHKFMFNNLFWSNWNLESIGRLYLIGNSFEFITSQSVEKNDPKEFAYLHRLRQLNIVNELKIKNCYTNKLVFNDLSIHTFTNTSHIQQSDLDQFFDPQYPIYKLDE